MWHEISRRSISTNKNDDTSIIWHNSILSVKTEKGLQLLDFAYNLDSLEKKVDLHVTVIPNPKCSPATGLFPGKFLKNCLSNEDITQMVLDPSLWPHNTQLTNEMATIASYGWSPIGMLHGNESILAILNNVGNVDLFGPEYHKWSTIHDLSDTIKAHFSPILKQKVNCLDDLRKIVNIVETVAMCWGPKVQDCTCFFVTAQKNGKILIWLLQSLKSEIKTELKAEIQTDVGEMFSIMWLPKSDKKFSLICPNVMGQIYALDFQMMKDNIEHIGTICIWEHKDRMIPKNFVHTIIDNKITLLFSKHRHLFAQQLNDESKIISQFIQNINDYTIKDISDSKDGIYLAAANCKIYKIHMNNLGGKFKVSLSAIETKDGYGMYELHSLKASTNSVIWAAAMADRTIKCRKYPEKIDLVFFCLDPQNNLETTVLLENPSKKLTYYWDCIELLRCKTMKSKALPSIDYFELYNDANNDLYKLKLYNIFVTLYNRLDNIIKNFSKGSLPETSIDIVRERICLSQAVELIKNLQQNSNELQNSFELECYRGATKFLENYCRKYDKNSDEFISSSFLHLTKMAPIYTCQGCDETLDGATCKNGHFNMLCSLTFTPIESDNYIACKSCNCTARMELYVNKPTCLFCDLYLRHLNYGV